MLSSEDHPGLFTLVIGIIVLVFTGVGLSIVADKRAKGGGAKAAAAREIQQADEEIVQMTQDKANLEEDIEKQSERVEKAAAGFARVSEQLKETEPKLEALTGKRNELRREVPNLESEFDEYRAKYRNSLWTTSVGKSLGVLRTRDGKLYSQAVIRRITSTSLEITCDQGPVMIPASNLDKVIQDRFQWTENELKMAQRHTPQAPVAEAPNPPQRPAPAPTPAGPSREEITKARTAVQLRLERVRGIESQLAEARNAVASGQRSIPGSLETWQARSERLQTALTRSRTELASAKADLARLDPSDPLAR
ncbi:MAG: hypothetical protein J0M04_08015 [Verrucomicrobia bacterium]|nr:hypothetical protein [Verrucomicrobiota bacterium]